MPARAPSAPCSNGSSAWHRASSTAEFFYRCCLGGGSVAAADIGVDLVDAAVGIEAQHVHHIEFIAAVDQDAQLAGDAVGGFEQAEDFDPQALDALEVVAGLGQGGGFADHRKVPVPQPD